MLTLIQGEAAGYRPPSRHVDRLAIRWPTLAAWLDIEIREWCKRIPPDDPSGQHAFAITASFVCRSIGTTDVPPDPTNHRLERILGMDWKSGAMDRSLAAVPSRKRGMELGWALLEEELADVQCSRKVALMAKTMFYTALLAMAPDDEFNRISPPRPVAKAG